MNDTGAVAQPVSTTPAAGGATPATTATATATPAAAGTTGGKNPSIERADGYLRLEEQAEARLAALAQRRVDEEEKLFAALLAAPDIARLGALWKACETATAAIDAEAAMIAKFQAALAERLGAFAKENKAAFRRGLNDRLRTLAKTPAGARRKAGPLKSRIALLEKRIAALGPSGRKRPAKKAAAEPTSKKT